MEEKIAAIECGLSILSYDYGKETVCALANEQLQVLSIGLIPGTLMKALVFANPICRSATTLFQL